MTLNWNFPALDISYDGSEVLMSKSNDHSECKCETYINHIRILEETISGDQSANVKLDKLAKSFNDNLHNIELENNKNIVKLVKLISESVVSSILRKELKLNDVVLNNLIERFTSSINNSITIVYSELDKEYVESSDYAKGYSYSYSDSLNQGEIIVNRKSDRFYVTRNGNISKMIDEIISEIYNVNEVNNH